MIQIYECTDCMHCASFDFGYRVFCLHPDLLPEEAVKYAPVGEESAHHCRGFDEDFAHEYSTKDLLEAEKHVVDSEMCTYEEVRAWCLENPK